MHAALLPIALLLSAPALKDKPKPSIVGEWVVESTQISGRVKQAKGNPDPLVYTFGDKGKLKVMHSDRKVGGDDRGYTIDQDKSPATIDLIADTTDQDSSITVGIFKIEGNQLTMIIARGRDGTRPATFAVDADTPRTLYIMKRK